MVKRAVKESNRMVPQVYMMGATTAKGFRLSPNCVTLLSEVEQVTEVTNHGAHSQPYLANPNRPNQFKMRTKMYGRGQLE